MGGLWDYCGMQNAAATAPHHSDRNIIMRKTLIPAMAAATLLLAACSGHSGYGEARDASVDNSTVTAVEATTPAREVKGSTEDEPWGPLEGTLLEQMQVRGIQPGNMTDDVAVSTGESLCRGADGGISHARLLEIVQDHMDGWDLADSILYIELSFENLCPEHATL